MNIYFITFPFRGEYVFAKVNANVLANRFIELDGSEYHFTTEDKQYTDEPFEIVNKTTKQIEKYNFEFNSKDTSLLSVYYSEDWGEELEGRIVEKNIPWLLLKVEEERGEELYNITDDWH